MLESNLNHTLHNSTDTSDLTVQDFEIVQSKTNDLVSIQYFCNKSGEPVYFPDRTLATLFQVNLSTLRGRFNRLTKKYVGYRLLISEKSKSRMTSLHFINWDNAGQQLASAAAAVSSATGGNHSPIIASDSTSSSSLGSSGNRVPAAAAPGTPVASQQLDDDLSNNYSTSLHGLVALNHITLVNYALSEWIAHNHERLGTSLREIEANLSRAQLTYTRQGDVIVLQQRKYQPGCNPSIANSSSSSTYSPKLSALSFLASSSSASSSHAASSFNNSSAPVTPRTTTNANTTNTTTINLNNPILFNGQQINPTSPDSSCNTYSLASFISDIASQHHHHQQQQPTPSQLFTKYQMVTPNPNSAASPSLTSTFRTLSPPFPNSTTLMYDRHFYETVSPSPSFGSTVVSPSGTPTNGNPIHHQQHHNNHHHLLHNQNVDIASLLSPNSSKKRTSLDYTSINNNNPANNGYSFSSDGSDSEVSSPSMPLKRAKQDSPNHNFNSNNNNASHNTVIKCKLYDQESYKKVDISLYNGFIPLRETLSAMFSIGHSFVICYQDSENDIIEINDQEDDWFDFYSIPVWKPASSCTENQPCYFDEISNWENNLAPWLDTNSDAQMGSTAQQQYIIINQTLQLGGINIGGPVNLVINGQVSFSRLAQLNQVRITAIPDPNNPLFFNGGVSATASTIIATSISLAGTSTISTLSGSFVVVLGNLTVTNTLLVTDILNLYPQSNLGLQCQYVNISNIDQADQSILSIQTPNLSVGVINSFGQVSITDSPNVVVANSSHLSTLVMSGNTQINFTDSEILDIRTSGSQPITLTLVGMSSIGSLSSSPLENIHIFVTADSVLQMSSGVSLSTNTSSITMDGATAYLNKLSSKSIHLNNQASLVPQGNQLIGDLVIDGDSKFVNILQNDTYNVDGSIFVNKGMLLAYAGTMVGKSITVGNGTFNLNLNGLISVGDSLNLTSESTLLIQQQQNTTDITEPYIFAETVILDGSVQFEFASQLNADQEYCIIQAKVASLGKNLKLSIASPQNPTFAPEDYSSFKLSVVKSKTDSSYKDCVMLTTKSQSDNNDDGGLSAWKIAVIVVGGVLFVALLTGLIIFIYKKRKISK
ncbi:Putative nuclease [Heterostelium album PN500]|uniref:Nuclease n=1 Tax=Heterostelium pallidum (strain ATCC 26659 / Pp 5 / PN500) TaxID=670386 RepID=D3BCZ9_HETP5|nr:Putative nuclease [Heterostelium album PN500]EFA80791.1 Putative nuclease [Heterostelium album PN500]|eukprot:XP_020432910.1 Putative nuclease [Heterostelium album PN500]